MSARLPPPTRLGVKASVSRKAAEVDQSFLDAFLRQGEELVARGAHAEAMDTAQRVVRLKETSETKGLFFECVKNWTYFDGAASLRDVLARALREPWGPPHDLLGIAKGILTRDKAVGSALQRADAAWPRRLPLRDLFGPGEFAAVAGDVLLLALLDSVVVPDAGFEHLLTSLRAGLLDLATGTHHERDERVQALCAALARQCYINEYVFDLAAGESERVQDLRARITGALERGTTVSPVALAVLAAYMPLGDLPAAAILKRSWPPSVRDVVDQQIREPAEHKRQQATIRAITPIADATSIAVRGQYEENPYPRWTKIAPATHSFPVDSMFRMEFPFSNFRDMGPDAGSDVLIAGCGTGHHSILFAQNFPHARTLAVDLSLSCLGYAKAKTQAMGLSGIDYAQADILELGGLNRDFGIISSSGVLHHLADPLRGWRVLLGLLRPNGCMHVGLYSERARQNIVAAQRWLAERNIQPTPGGIRGARQALAQAEDPALRQMTQLRDFYSTSECRDLLFPRQERRFTIPQIQDFLAANDLEFLGFLLPGNVRAAFRKRFTAEGEAELGLWRQFEADQPNAFIGMYQFWVQKRA